MGTGGVAIPIGGGSRVQGVSQLCSYCETVACACRACRCAFSVVGNQWRVISISFEISTGRAGGSELRWYSESS